METDKIKKTAFNAIDTESGSVTRLSRYINDNPEPAYKEVLACEAIKDLLKDYGFHITSAVGGLDTAFVADYFLPESLTGHNEGDGIPHANNSCPVALIAEYDALEGVGHGCGHNLIAAGAVAAAIGTRAAIEAGFKEGMSPVLQKLSGPVFRVIGTPAEEILTEEAGKKRLIEAGVFDGTDNCLMFHPWTSTGVARKDLGCTAYRIVFKGAPAHAAADPWNGRNALDAAVLFYNSISMLRQQLPPGIKLHCILPDGGAVLNVIPDMASAEVMLRSTELDELEAVSDRINVCAGAAATAAGCSFEVKRTASIKPVKFDSGLFGLAAENAALLGEQLEELPIWEASSDFGDVSRIIPSLSVLYKTHDENTRWHSCDAAEEARSGPAQQAMLRAAKILSATALDLLFSR